MKVKKSSHSFMFSEIAYSKQHPSTYDLDKIDLPDDPFVYLWKVWTKTIQILIFLVS